MAEAEPKVVSSEESPHTRKLAKVTRLRLSGAITGSYDENMFTPSSKRLCSLDSDTVTARHSYKLPLRRIDTKAFQSQLDLILSEHDRAAKNFEKKYIPFKTKDLKRGGKVCESVYSKAIQDSDGDAEGEIALKVPAGKEVFAPLLTKLEEQIQQEDKKQSTVYQHNTVKSQEMRRANVVFMTHARLEQRCFVMDWDTLYQLGRSVPHVTLADSLEMAKSHFRERTERAARRTMLARCFIGSVKRCLKLSNACRFKLRLAFLDFAAQVAKYVVELPLPVQGLINLGNTCYLNSAINTLFYIDPVNKFMKTLKGHQGTELSLVFQQFCRQYQTGQDVTPLLLNIFKYLPEFADGRQHCAFAFTQKFLAQLDKDLPSPAALGFDSPLSSRLYSFQKNKCKELHSLFSSLTENVFICSECFHHWEKSSYARALEVQIPERTLERDGTTYFGPMDFYNPEVAAKFAGNGAAAEFIEAFKELDERRLKEDIELSQKPATLDLCLQHLFRANLMTANNTFDCEACGRETPHFKQSFPQHLSPVLQIHLQRFTESSSQKVDTRVDCPEVLDLQKYLPGAGEYQLAGVISHTGAVSGGHYTAYVKVRGTWYLFNDNAVSEVPRGTDLLQAASTVTYIKQ